jgi:hypothetical protein
MYASTACNMLLTSSKPCSTVPCRWPSWRLTCTRWAVMVVLEACMACSHSATCFSSTPCPCSSLSSFSMPPTACNSSRGFSTCVGALRGLHMRLHVIT